MVHIQSFSYVWSLLVRMDIFAFTDFRQLTTLSQRQLATKSRPRESNIFLMANASSLIARYPKRFLQWSSGHAAVIVVGMSPLVRVLHTLRMTAELIIKSWTDRWEKWNQLGESSTLLWTCLNAFFPPQLEYFSSFKNQCLANLHRDTLLGSILMTLVIGN